MLAAAMMTAMYVVRAVRATRRSGARSAAATPARSLDLSWAEWSSDFP